MTSKRLVPSVPVASAVRRAWKKGYGRADLRHDVLAGLVVGVVALPLSMALAIAVGAPPQHGLYTAIFAGAVTALLGGSKFQVTGPTAAFVVILAPIVTEHGLSGLLTAGFLAGIFMVILGLARMGSLIRFVPYPVTTGFTAGIAVVIATLQIKDLLGLEVGPLPEHFHEKLVSLWQARATADWREALVAAATLALLFAFPKAVPRVPAPLLAIGTVSVGAAAATAIWPELDIATIGNRFHYTADDGAEVAGIPSMLPRPAAPWANLRLDFDQVRALLPSAFAIALLGAIESQLSSVIADGMTNTRHDPNAELVGQGMGNIVAPFFGGIAATGALARTATSIHAGARSPVAAVTHAAVVLVAMLFLAPLVAYIPMASLAALLLVVAWNMSELPHFVSIVRVAPRSDVVVLVTCFLLTVVFDMVWAVSVGFVLAAILFMRRMADLTESGFALDGTEERPLPQLPPGVAIYAVNGPLFFGAAHQAMESLHAAHGDAFRTLILDLGRVTVIDATGFAALENTLHNLRARDKKVILAGPLPRPTSLWDRAREHGILDGVVVAPSRDAALARVSEPPPAPA